MTCTHCGESALSMQYTLRFSPDTMATRELDLYLCDACLSEFCNEPTIELVGDPAMESVKRLRG